MRINAAKVFLVGAMVCGMTLDAAAGVVAYWDFGSNGVADVSGNGHTLTNSGVVFRGGMAVFGGTQAVFNTVSTLDLSAYAGITVEYFIRSTTANDCIVLEHSKICNNNPGCFLSELGGFSLPGSVSGALRTTPANNYNIELSPAGAATDGRWHHVALVIDSSKRGADRAQLYVDRVRQSTYANLTNDAVTPFRNETFYIGSRSNTVNKLTGQLDDVRISDQALSTNQFLQLPTLVPEVAYWPFAPGAETVDATGNGNTLTNSGVAFAKGAASFSGTQTVFSTIGKLDLSGYPAVTLEYFIRTSSTNNSTVIEHSANGGSYTGGLGSAYSDFNSSGNLTGFLKTSDGYNIDATAAGAASDDRWHHVAVVIDPAKASADRLQLYFDKVRQAKKAPYTNDAATPFRNDTLFIGSRGNSTLKFVGQLDDVRVTGRVLATNEFLQIPTTDLPQGVLAYWPFAPGTELADVTGNGNALTNQGIRFYGGAAFFSGTQTMFNTLGKLDLRWYPSVTVEYFIRTSSTNNSLVLEHSTNTMFCAGAFCSALGESHIPGLLTGAFRTTPVNCYNIEATAAGAASDDKWHHVAVVIDSSKAGADRAQLYFDKARQATYGNYTNDAVTAFRNDVLYIGSRANSGFQFSGRLDDIRVTGAALAPSQFMTLRSDPTRGTAILIQ